MSVGPHTIAPAVLAAGLLLAASAAIGQAGPADPALAAMCEDVKSAARSRLASKGLAADPVFSGAPVAPDTESWSVEWLGLKLAFPAEEHGWHYGAFGKGEQRMLQVGLEDRLTWRLGQWDLGDRVERLDTLVARRGLEPPARGVYEMLVEGLAVAGDALDCAGATPSLDTLYGVQLKSALLRTPGDVIYRKQGGIVVRSDFGERGESWHLLAPHPDSRLVLLSVQAVDRGFERPQPVLLLLGDRNRSAVSAPSWAFHLFAYLESRGFEHLDWLEQRARDPQQRAAAASLRKVFPPR